MAQLFISQDRLDAWNAEQAPPLAAREDTAGQAPGTPKTKAAAKKAARKAARKQAAAKQAETKDER